MFVVVRVDASHRVGVGHVMRCLSLAVELQKQGAVVKFICRDYGGNLISFLRDKSMQVSVLRTSQVDVSSPYSLCRSLGVTQEEDANQTIQLLEGRTPDWVIVDHYELNKTWETKVCAFTKKMMVIDDMANRSHYCDVLLDQTYGRQSKEYYPLVPNKAVLLLGATYALLRAEFFEWRKYSLERRISCELKQILINMGGTDPDNATGEVLRVIADNDLFSDSNILVIMGSASLWLEDVKRQIKSMGDHVEVKVNISNMAQVMAMSDLAIGAAGTSVWERCCLGLPSIIFKLAENQSFISHQLERNGIALFAGEIKDIKHSLITSANQVANPACMKKLSDLSENVSDGMGVKRVMEVML